MELDHDVHLLRAAAQECRQAGADLSRRAAAVQWGGLTGAAFREAAASQSGSLAALAHLLEGASTTVAAHAAMVEEVERLAALAAAAGADLVEGAGSAASAVGGAVADAVTGLLD